VQVSSHWSCLLLVLDHVLFTPTTLDVVRSNIFTLSIVYECVKGTLS